MRKRATKRLIDILCRLGLHWHKKLAYYDPQGDMTHYAYYCPGCGKDWVETTDRDVDLEMRSW